MLNRTGLRQSGRQMVSAAGQGVVEYVGALVTSLVLIGAALVLTQQGGAAAQTFREVFNWLHSIFQGVF